MDLNKAFIQVFKHYQFRNQQQNNATRVTHKCVGRKKKKILGNVHQLLGKSGIVMNKNIYNKIRFLFHDRHIYEKN